MVCVFCAEQQRHAKKNIDPKKREEKKARTGLQQIYNATSTKFRGSDDRDRGAKFLSLARTHVLVPALPGVGLCTRTRHGRACSGTSIHRRPVFALQLRTSTGARVRSFGCMGSLQLEWKDDDHSPGPYRRKRRPTADAFSGATCTVARFLRCLVAPLTTRRDHIIPGVHASGPSSYVNRGVKNDKPSFSFLCLFRHN
jgi:hypothetical protein